MDPVLSPPTVSGWRHEDFRGHAGWKHQEKQQPSNHCRSHPVSKPQADFFADCWKTPKSNVSASLLLAVNVLMCLPLTQKINLNYFVHVFKKKKKKAFGWCLSTQLWLAAVGFNSRWIKLRPCLRAFHPRRLCGPSVWLFRRWGEKQLIVWQRSPTTVFLRGNSGSSGSEAPPHPAIPLGAEVRRRHLTYCYLQRPAWGWSKQHLPLMHRYT